MRSPGDIDPILAFLDYLERYRRSRSCWWIGGPAAVDDLTIIGRHQTLGVRVEGEVGWEGVVWPIGVLRRRIFRRQVFPREAEAAGSWEAGDPQWHQGDEGRWEASGLLRAAWRRAERHVELVATGAEELWGQLWEVCRGRAAFTAAVESACTDIEGRILTASVGCAVVQQMKARIAHAGMVSFRLARTDGRFWAVGTAGAHRAGLQSFGQAVSGHLQILMLLPALWLPSGLFGWDLNLWWAAIPLVSSALRREQRAAEQARRPDRLTLYKYALRSLRAKPMPEISVVGPHAGRSALLYSLFAHLASYAQLEERSGGATLLDEGYGELQAMLQEGSEPPEGSSTCRMEMAAGGRVRLTHVVLPPERETGPLCRRALARAAQVWLVVPAAGGEGADCRAAEVLHYTAAPVTVILDGASGPDPLARLPETRAALARRRHRRWATDLAALRDRYLAGGVPAEEAAGVVEWLMDPNAPEAGGLALPAAAAGDVGVERSREQQR